MTCDCSDGFEGNYCENEKKKEKSEKSSVLYVVILLVLLVSRWWVYVDLQVLFGFWNFCLISWCFLVEDGLEVCFPSLGLFCFTGDNFSIHIFNWNIAIFKTASQRFGYLVQCGHVLCLCCCFCFICQIFDEGSLVCSRLPFDLFVQF